MTDLLMKAFQEASKLPPNEQDAFAALVLAELESEARWEQAMSGSLDLLKALEEEALADLNEGRTEPLDPDTM
jgi:hypothetical protein